MFHACGAVFCGLGLEGGYVPTFCFLPYQHGPRLLGALFSVEILRLYCRTVIVQELLETCHGMFIWE